MHTHMHTHMHDPCMQRHKVLKAESELGPVYGHVCMCIDMCVDMCISGSTDVAMLRRPPCQVKVKPCQVKVKPCYGIVPTVPCASKIMHKDGSINPRLQK